MKWDVLFQNIQVTSEASCTNVVEVKVLVALGSTFDEEAELVKEIVVLEPEGGAVGNPWTIPMDCWW